MIYDIFEPHTLIHTLRQGTRNIGSTGVGVRYLILLLNTCSLGSLRGGRRMFMNEERESTSFKRPKNTH
jgi:hypothetical protein